MPSSRPTLSYHHLWYGGGYGFNIWILERYKHLDHSNHHPWILEEHFFCRERGQIPSRRLIGAFFFITFFKNYLIIRDTWYETGLPQERYLSLSSVLQVVKQRLKVPPRGTLWGTVQSKIVRSLILEKNDFRHFQEDCFNQESTKIIQAGPRLGTIIMGRNTKDRGSYRFFFPKGVPKAVLFWPSFLSSPTSKCLGSLSYPHFSLWLQKMNTDQARGRQCRCETFGMSLLSALPLPVTFHVQA